MILLCSPLIAFFHETKGQAYEVYGFTVDKTEHRKKKKAKYILSDSFRLRLNKMNRTPMQMDSQSAEPFSSNIGLH